MRDNMKCALTAYILSVLTCLQIIPVFENMLALCFGGGRKVQDKETITTLLNEETEAWAVGMLRVRESIRINKNGCDKQTVRTIPGFSSVVLN